MPGYGDTMLQGMQGILQMRRMQQAEQQNNWRQQHADRQLMRQYEQMEQQGWLQDRRLQQGLQVQERQNLEFQNRMRDQDRNFGLREKEARRREEEFRAEAAQRERIAQEAARGKLKPGFAWDPVDKMKQVPVSGGPAWRELSSKHADDLNRLGAFGEIADSSRATIERILDPKVEKTGFNPNFGGYNAALITQHMPGAVPTFGQTQNVRNDLENLKSNLKAQGASLMRGVGGAPGSITEREWPILEKMIESLSPLMEEKEAREALGRISTRFEGMKQRSLANYKAEWGDSPFVKADPFSAPPAGSAGTLPEGMDPRVWKFMTPAEKALWQKQ